MELVGDQILVADIHETASSFPSEFAEVGNLAYFSAIRAASEGGVWKDYGRELFVTDGTASGTSLVQDICPGTCSSSPSSLRAGTSKVWFLADDGVHGNELWSAAGGSATRVTDIQAGAASTDIRDITPFQSSVFFSAFQTGDTARRLWLGNSQLGTVASPNNLLVVDDLLYFSGEDSSGDGELWESDGTVGGTHRIADINPGTGSSRPRDLVALGSTIIFIADDGSSGDELWKYEGGVATQVKDLVAGKGSPFSDVDVNPDLTVLGNYVYFVAQVDNSGVELWRTDGTSAGTVMVKDINLGTPSGWPQSLTAAGQFLYFSADDGQAGRELWRSNGTSTGTVRLTDIEPNGGSSNPYGLTATSDEVVFVAESSMNGTELWRADIRGAHYVTSFGSGPDHEILGTLGYYQWKGRVLFSASFGSTNNYELWSLDVRRPEPIKEDPQMPIASASGDIAVLDGVGYVNAVVNGDSEIISSEGEFIDAYSNGSSVPRDLVAMNGALYFSGQGWNGRILYSYTPGGATSEVPVSSGNVASTPQELVMVEKAGAQYLYFTALSTTTGDRQVFMYDGSGNQAQLLTSTVGLNPRKLTAYNGAVYFLGTTTAEGEELWSHSPGAPSPTAPLDDINGGPADSSIGEMVAGQDGVYFNACTASDDCQLWRRGPWGLEMLTFDNVGMGGVSPSSITAVNNQVYFAGDNGFDGVEPWVYDSGLGAMALPEVNTSPNTGSNPRFFMGDGTGTYVYFQANDGTMGAELWYTDGWSVGLVKDLRPGLAPSSPRPLMAVAGRVYFSANDGVSGVELHYTNGPGYVASPFDFNPGVASSSPSGMVQVDGGWLFTATTPAGRRLFFGDNL